MVVAYIDFEGGEWKAFPFSDVEALLLNEAIDHYPVGKGKRCVARWTCETEKGELRFHAVKLNDKRIWDVINGYREDPYVREERRDEPKPRQPVHSGAAALEWDD